MTQTDIAQTELTSDHSSHSRSRCGGALRLEREKQALSIQDVANKLRLSAKQIEALEADNFASLPEATIVRGFIRNYAKLLKMNTEPLLDAYTVIVPSSAPYEMTIKPTSNMHVSSKDKPKKSSYIWLGLAALLTLGVWIFYQNYIAKPNPTAPIASTSKVEPLPEPALPVAERSPELQPSTELTLPSAAETMAPVSLPAAPVNNIVGNNLTSSATTTTVLPTTEPSLLAEVPSSVSAAAGMSKLEFSANQETWVSVVDASGREVYNKIIFAGSRESIDVTLPVDVTVGNAGGTNMSKNGKAIELAPHTRNNVAHIKLDN